MQSSCLNIPDFCKRIDFSYSGRKASRQINLTSIKFLNETTHHMTQPSTPQDELGGQGNALTEGLKPLWQRDAAQFSFDDNDSIQSDDSDSTQPDDSDSTKMIASLFHLLAQREHQLAQMQVQTVICSRELSKQISENKKLRKANQRLKERKAMKPKDTRRNSTDQTLSTPDLSKTGPGFSRMLHNLWRSLARRPGAS